MLLDKITKQTSSSVALDFLRGIYAKRCENLISPSLAYSDCQHSKRGKELTAEQ